MHIVYTSGYYFFKVVIEIKSNSEIFSDFRLQTSDFRLQTSDFGLQTSDFGLQTSDFGLQTSDFGLRTSDFGLQTSDLVPRLPLTPKKQINSHAREIKFFAEFVFQETPVRFVDVLRQITEKRKLWCRCRKLSNVFYLNMFSFNRRRWCIVDDGQKIFIQLRCLYFFLPVFINMYSKF